MTLRAEKSAVLVIDMHRGSLEAPGTVFIPGATSLYPALSSLLDGARERSIPVVYIVHQTDPSGRDARNPFWVECDNILDLYPNVGEQVIGSPWTEIPAPIAPKPGDVVIPKKRYGAFSGNGLMQVLRMWGVDTLILTGVATEICVLATAFEGFNNDFRVLLASDCVKAKDPDLEAAAQSIIAREVGWVLSSREILDAYSEAAMASNA
jgi:nicotinamidase-related amidase